MYLYDKYDKSDMRGRDIKGQKMIDSLNLNTLSDRLTLVEICEYDIDIANICITAIGKLIHVWLPTSNLQPRGCMCVCVCECVRVYMYMYMISVADTKYWRQLRVSKNF